MAKINLNDEEKQNLIEALNNNVEPSPDLLPKLFPATADKIDYTKLDRAKIPTLEYAGKRNKASILAEASAGIGAGPLQTVRCFGDVKEDEWKNMIVQGDNLQFLKTCYKNEDPLIKDKVKGKVKLIYIDPPFGTGDEYGAASGEHSYTAKLMGAEFIESLRERIVLLNELLSKDGGIFVRIDYHFGQYVKVILDEIFGRYNFRNDVIVNRTIQGALNTQFKGIRSMNVGCDYLFWYSKSPETRYKPFFKSAGDKGKSYWHGFWKPGERPNLRYDLLGITPQKGQWLWSENRSALAKENYLEYLQEFEKSGISLDAYWAKTGKSKEFVKRDGNSKSVNSVKYWIPPRDKIFANTNWTDIPGYSFGWSYPTENSESLLERIIGATTYKDDLVLDCFAGSGTTPVVAEKLGRRWIACDFGKHSIYTMQKRMLRIGESKALEDEKNEAGEVIVKKGDTYSKDAKPFCVVSTGAYDFTHIMELRKHKETYINFVLGLFQLSRDEEKAKRFKLANIFAERDGHPVEVYPVWEDEFLKEVKIDEEYLEGIITQSGGKLRGDYYIISPETCTNIGDTTIKNSEGKDITFKILSFPYKVLEDVSRKLTLQDQPSSPDQVNQLISSTAFYFNEDVEIEAERVKDGFKITKFETKILDKEGNKFEGFTGVAMILVDDEYEEGKPFDMDKTVFAKDIKEDGLVSIPGLGKSVAVIAIDKHGNESKPLKIK